MDGKRNGGAIAPAWCRDQRPRLQMNWLVSETANLFLTTTALPHLLLQHSRQRTPPYAPAPPRRTGWTDFLCLFESTCIILARTLAPSSARCQPILKIMAGVFPFGGSKHREQ